MVKFLYRFPLETPNYFFPGARHSKGLHCSRLNPASLAAEFSLPPLPSTSVVRNHQKMFLQVLRTGVLQPFYLPLRRCGRYPSPAPVVKLAFLTLPAVTTSGFLSTSGPLHGGGSFTQHEDTPPAGILLRLPCPRPQAILNVKAAQLFFFLPPSGVFPRHGTCRREVQDPIQ